MSNERILREKAREIILGGNLPARPPDRMWGGLGSGAPCMVCGVALKQDEVALEIEFTQSNGHGASNHHLHVRCYSALELERHSLELARRSGAAGDQKRPPRTAARGRESGA